MVLGFAGGGAKGGSGGFQSTIGGSLPSDAAFQLLHGSASGSRNFLRATRYILSS